MSVVVTENKSVQGDAWLKETKKAEKAEKPEKAEKASKEKK